MGTAESKPAEPQTTGTNDNDVPPSGTLLRGTLHSTSSGKFHVTDSVMSSSVEGNNNNHNAVAINVGGPNADATKNGQLQFGGDTAVPNDPGADNVIKIDFLKDDKKEMTWGRRIALSLADKPWYNPRAAVPPADASTDDDDAGAAVGDEDNKNNKNNNSNQNGKDANDVLEDEETSGDVTTEDDSHESSKHDDFDEMISNKEPNLAKSWAYFEHVALYRFIVPPEEDMNKTKKNICVRIVRKLFCKANKKLERAEPGENTNKTRLYDPIFTPHNQLGDFGLGIGLYFSTLRAIAFITLVGGLFSIYNMNYFSSDAYMPEESRNQIDSALVRGSAVCTDLSWVPCPTCNCSAVDEVPEFGFLPADRCAYDSTGNLTFALRNNCDGTPWQLAAVNYSTVIWLLIATLLLGMYVKRQEITFDEDEQTAQDYSVLISNPPEDAKDPEEWRKFFAENLNAQLTVCTIAVDNDLLVRTLVERRERLRIIHNMQEPGSSMRMLDLAKIAAEQERQRGFFGRIMAMVIPGLPEHFARVVALNSKVGGLAQLAYPAKNIFCVFETEADQRKVLETLSVGKIKSDRNDTTAIADPKYLFRGTHVLAVDEPDEPNTVRWQDLNAGGWQKFKERCLTTFVTLVTIVLAAFCIDLANKASVVGAAFTIAVFNSLFPMLAKLLTSFESHASEGRKQTSLYSKVAVFRWVGSAIVIAVITPFTSTLSLDEGLITQVYALYFADIITTNALALADPFGHLQRHYLAPRAATQDAADLLFSGTQYELAERYTDATKILFLTLWYSSVYPGAFFMCSVSLLIKYFVDRFCLMRVWKKAPALGPKISSFSRQYFFPLAIVAMAVMSSFYWAGFPFDNICPNESVDERYENVKVVYPMTGEIEVRNPAETEEYRFCNQNFMAIGSGPSFPFVPANGDEWMTDDQITMTTIFGWTSIAILAVVVLKFCWGWWSSIQALYESTYEPVGDDQNIPFSSVESRSAYIPQVVSPQFSYPLLACSSDSIDEELYDWVDPARKFSWYDLTKDASKLLEGIPHQNGAGFSIVKHWPPEEQGEESE